MSDRALHRLARAVGLDVAWTDAFGQKRTVSPGTIRRVLSALGYSADDDAAIGESFARVRREQRVGVPALVTATADHRIVVPAALVGRRAGAFRIELESGDTIEGRVEPPRHARRVTLPAVVPVGYHRLHVGDRSVTLAVAPRRAPTPADVIGTERSFGYAVQLYALRRAGDGGIGDYAALAEFVRAAAKTGAQAVMASPVHAGFAAFPGRASPYAPSTRLWRNPVYAAIEGLPDSATDRVDWAAATRLRFDALRRELAALTPERRAEFDAWRQSHGASLEAQARFEALHAHFVAQGIDRWQDWPVEFREAASAAVARFASEQAEEVTFHAFAQWRVDASAAAAQAAARDAGMRVGIVNDLAVGTDPSGSQAWSRGDELLRGLSVGAPPDLLNANGQGWGLTAFSPTALRSGGFAGFIDTVRAALSHAGGLRVDHALGLKRMWLVPDGVAPTEGAYLRYPFVDQLRLLRLEAHRANAIVIAEDLGTVPPGFRDVLHRSGFLGMAVMPFERDDDGFVPPSLWAPSSAAMTGTHDMPTFAGWWRGDDVPLRANLGLLGGATADEAATERERERAGLWRAMTASGAAQGDAPPAADPQRALDAAVRHVAASECAVALFPLEDIVGSTAQVNLPGTVDEHPNWRARYPTLAAQTFDDPVVASRVAAIAETRRR